MRKLSLITLALTGAVAGGTVSAATIDFESVPTGLYSSVTTGGVTFTFTAGTGLFNVDDQTPGPPISGHNLISYMQNPGPGAFMATLPGGVTSFTIGCGDFALSDDDECYLEAYSSGNVLLDTGFFSQPQSHPGGGGYLSVSSATPIAYVRFYEVGSFAGAVYWDNVKYEVAHPSVPEPGTIALLGLGLAGLGLSRRRKA